MTEQSGAQPLVQLLYKPEQAAVILSVGRTKIYALIASGQLRSVKIDGLRRIPAAALTDYANRLDLEAAA